jgi:putative oxidoreductase
MPNSSEMTLFHALLVAGRLLLALIFLHEGASLLTHFSAAAASVGKLGVPASVLALTVALQLGAGAMIALGWHARPAALALALFCLATAFTFHTNVAVQNELLHFEKDLAIAGGMLVLAVTGSGRLSLDRRGRIGWRRRDHGAESSLLFNDDPAA